MLEPDGSVTRTEILDHARMNKPGQAFYKVLAESALRAVKLCQPLRVPTTGYEPYIVIGDEFQQPYTADIQNSCTTCHRPQCTEHFQNYPLDELIMPPPFENVNDYDHSIISNEDREAIREWCNTLNL